MNATELLAILDDCADRVRHGKPSKAAYTKAMLARAAVAELLRARELSAHGGDGGADSDSGVWDIPGASMALHWIDRYATGIDDVCQLDRVAAALATQQPASGEVVDLASKYRVLHTLLNRSWKEVYIGTKKFQLTLTVTPEYLERIQAAMETTPAIAAHGDNRNSIRRMNYAAWMEDSRNGSEPPPDWQEGYGQGRHAQAEAEAAHGGSGEELLVQRPIEPHAASAISPSATLHAGAPPTGASDAEVEALVAQYAVDGRVEFTELQFRHFIGLPTRSPARVGGESGRPTLLGWPKPA